jgi:hypothetical protein
MGVQAQQRDAHRQSEKHGAPRAALVVRKLELCQARPKRDREGRPQYAVVESG